jgi:transposase InsO family protein
MLDNVPWLPNLNKMASDNPGAVQIEAFVEHYNHQRYNESLNNVTPADACSGRAQAILKQRES